MTHNKRDADFVHYLESIVNLDALDRMTRDLDDELEDSQQVMNSIKGMIDTLPVSVEGMKTESDSNGLRQQEMSNFLTAGTPNLLMDDMDDNIADIDLNDVIATMKCYTEDLKKNFTLAELQKETKFSKIENLDLGQYASSLDQLSKRLANLNLNKKDEALRRNAELEAKVSVLCDDVNTFTKMVQAKTSLSETNQNWLQSQQQPHALEYDNLINKLLSGINEVTYLLQNKN